MGRAEVVVSNRRCLDCVYLCEGDVQHRTVCEGDDNQRDDVDACKKDVFVFKNKYSFGIIS